MVRHQIALAGIAVVALALVAATGLALAAGDSQPGLIAAQGPGTSAAELLEYILHENPYTAWSSWPADRWSDFADYLVGVGPHGATVRIFVNDVALEAIGSEEFSGVLPYGSIIVKESFMGTVDEPGDAAALTVMYKLGGFNPEGGDWFWLKTPGDGSTIEAEGVAEGCIGCHAQEGSADFMLRYNYGEQPVAFYGEPLPEATGEAIVQYVLSTNPYAGWGSWPPNGAEDFSGLLLGTEPHGSVVRIFVNERALRAIARNNFDGTLPNGSIIVEENYMGTLEEPGELAALTIMYKVGGFNPEANDWFWVSASGDGSAVNAEGAAEGCISCHGQEGNTDYVLRYALPLGAASSQAMEPAIDANALIDLRCTACHTRDRIDRASKNVAGWATTIDRMIGKGAQLSAAEREALIAFLSSR